MSNKMPLPPVDGIGSDNETGEEQQPLSKAELRRREKEESRQRAKLQKVELEKIRREMKQPVSKTSLILGTLLVVFFLILVVGGYYFYCYYRINLWRKMFMDEYNKANLADISKYAPDYLERVEKYRELAERGGSIIGAEEVRQQYEEAAKVLREALDKLQEERDRYRTAKEKLDELLATAAERKLKEYVPAIWDRVVTLKKEATDETDSDFSSERAVAKLSEVMEILQDVENEYDTIREYDKVYSAFAKLHEGLNEDEWARNLPDKLGELQSKISRAKSAVALGQWKDATVQYQAALAVLESASESTGAARLTALKAAEAFAAALEQANAAELAANDSAAWANLSKQKDAIDDALERYDYGTAARTAQTAITQLAEIEANVAKAKTSRDEKLQELARVYEKAREQEKFLRINWRDEWLELEKRYQEIDRLMPTGEYVVLLRKADEVKAALEEMLQRRETLIETTELARREMKKLQGDPRVRILSVNFPELNQQAVFSQQGADRETRRNNLTAARQGYERARTLIAEGLEKLVKLEKETKSLRDACRERRQTFKRGLELFRARHIREIDTLTHLAEVHMERDNYSLALPLYKKIGDLLPAARFTRDHEGTVTDNAMGAVWVGDGAGPGCYNGQSLTWYEAWTWCDELSFGGFDNWRLPTEEELRVLLLLPENQRDQIFPNTKPAAYWSKISAQQVDQALAVDFSRNSIVREPKKAKHYLRPIHTPE